MINGYYDIISINHMRSAKDQLVRNKAYVKKRVDDWFKVHNDEFNKK